MHAVFQHNYIPYHVLTHVVMVYIVCDECFCEVISTVKPPNNVIM